MISYCQCRRQAIPPLEGQCRRGSEQESSWKTIIGSCCDSSCQARGSTCSGDVAHDAYLRVLERSSQAQIEHPKAFLYRTALNLAVDEHRRSRVRRAEPLEVLDDEEGLASPSPQTVVDQGQRLDNLQRALAELPAICRSSFLLRKLDGLSHSQIAEHLNISAAWWKSTSSTR